MIKRFLFATISLLLLTTFIVPSAFAAPMDQGLSGMQTALMYSPIAQTNSAKQILFAVDGGKFTYVEIEGFNQNGVLTVWRYSNTKNYTIVQTGAQYSADYWWQGAIRITVDIVDVGRRTCIIENLKTNTKEKYTNVVYSAKYGCSRASNPSTTVVPPLVFYYQFDEFLESNDAYKIYSQLGWAKDYVQCGSSIAAGLALKNATIVGKGCKGLAKSVVEDVLKKYGKNFVIE